MSYFLETEGGSLVIDELSDPPFAIGYVDGEPIFEGDYCLIFVEPNQCIEEDYPF